MSTLFPNNLHGFIGHDTDHGSICARDCYADLRARLAFSTSRYVVVMGLMDDKVAAAFVGTELSAGDMASAFKSFELINIVFNMAAYNQAAQINLATPIRKGFAANAEPEQVLIALENLGVNRSEDILFVWLGADVYPVADEQPLADVQNIDLLIQYFEQWKVLSRRHGLIVFFTSSLNNTNPVTANDGDVSIDVGHCPNDINRLLMVAAMSGFFPKPDNAMLYYAQNEKIYACLYWFEERKYSVRKPLPNDIKALAYLEQQCWIESRRSSVDDINLRITRNPGGQWLLEYEGEIVGAVYSQRIPAVDVLHGAISNSVAKHHVPDSRIVQLLSVNILPEMQHLGLGDQLLEFVLQCCSVTHGVERVAAVSLCKDYVSHATMPMDSYIHARDESGALIDPILRFHDSHGASIVGLVPGYRPADRDNFSNGVLVAYDLRNRKSRRFVPAILSSASAYSAQSLDFDSVFHVVEDGICKLLGVGRLASYAADRSLMSMGMDSLDLMRLRSYLAGYLGSELEASFFFRYSTTNAITTALQRMLLGNPDAAAQPVAAESTTWRHHRPTAELNASKVSTARSAGVTGDIAIIGLGCRFPAANSVEEYWSLLRNGGDGIGLVPATRWDNKRYHVPGDASDSPISSDRGGFIDNVDQFDAAFFGISPREANLLDPQQRLLLEVTYEALEHAAISPDSLRGSNTSAFVGLFSHDYELLQVKQNQDKDYEPYFATGNSNAVAAGRLAYALGWHGPAITVDTACSSSLVAVHLACQSLNTGESAIAIAGGVNLLLSPELSMAFSRAGMLSPDGCCRTFDEGANGYVRSEGCGIVVLKPLHQAVRDNDNVLAVIKGSAVNQDGASNGLTAPNQLAQEAVIRRALDVSGLKVEQVSYVEAHGTGTPLGDPVEMHALRSVYGEARSKANPLIVGSVKTNIGHTEAAAGIAGLIKVVLSLQHAYIPPHLHFRSPNSHLDLNSVPAVIPVKGCEWLKSSEQALRVAGVSSFGFSGTNAHVLVQESPVQDKSVNDARLHHVLPLSAKSNSALRALAGHFAEQLDSRPGLRLADVCYTAATGRSSFPHRLSVTASSLNDARAQLILAAEQSVKDASNSILPGASARVAFLFTGQGSQSVGMGKELYITHAGFRQSLDRCAEYLKPYCEIPLLDVLFEGDDERSVLHETAYTQPALFALEYSLAQLWISWGLKPVALMGHSVGEYAAACVGGVMSLEDGCKLIAARARLMQALPENGAMAAVFADRDRIAQAIAPYAQHVSIAADNGPAHTVISGERDCVRAICERLEKVSISHRELRVSRGFHSPLMEPMLAEFQRVAASINFSVSRIDIISNVTGQRVGNEITQPEYWVRHVRQAVQFQTGILTLQKMGVSTFVEIGPKPVLIGMARRFISDEKLQWLPALNTGMSDWEQVSRSVAALFTSGYAIDWNAYYQATGYNKLVLPSYPFERKRFWLEASLQKAVVRNAVDASCHPLLGSKLRSALQHIQFESAVSTRSIMYLGDHQVFQRALFPAAACVEMAFAAGHNIDPAKNWIATDIRFVRALELTEAEERPLQFILTQTEKSSHKNFEFQLFSLADNAAETDDQWQLHASGTLLAKVVTALDIIDIKSLRETIKSRIDAAEFYASLRNREYGYGPLFQAIQSLWIGKDEILAKLKLPSALSPVKAEYCLHPILLDASFQAALAFTSSDTWVPVGLASAQLARQIVSDDLWAHIKLHSSINSVADGLLVDIVLIADDGRVIARINELEFQLVTRAMLSMSPADSAADVCYVTQWRERPLVNDISAADFLVPSAKLAHVLDTHFASITDINKSALMLRELELISAYFVAAALTDMGQDISPGTRFTTQALRMHCGVAERHSSQLTRLLDVMCEHGMLARDADAWQVPGFDMPTSVRQKLLQTRERFPQICEELDLLGRCGQNLAAVLQGRCDPLQLLFPEGDLQAAARFYEQSPTFHDMNRELGEALAVAIENKPAGRALRILEIGAGTGGLTAHVLKHLPANDTQYVFTDLSNLFLNKAAERFSQFSFIDYKLLDIERQPLDQGFAAHEFDIVLAANVLHATRDLKKTLLHVKQLLAPNGMLVLLEGTARRSWIDLIFGMTEGWWKFTDYELRSQHPLLSDQQWKGLLSDIGFDDSVSISPDPHNDHMLFKQSIIVARAPDESVVCKFRPKRWLIFADATGVAEKLVECFIAQNDEIVLVRRGSQYKRIDNMTVQICADSQSDYAHLLADFAESSRELSGVVHLWSLDLAGGDDILSNNGVAGLEKFSYGSVLELIKSMITAEYNTPPRLWLITRGAQSVTGDRISGVTQSLLWGMRKVIALEHPEVLCSNFDMDPEHDDVSGLYDEIVHANDEDQVAVRNAIRYVARLARYDSTWFAPVATSLTQQLVIRERGTLDDLVLDKKLRTAPVGTELEIRVHAAGLNFRDILNALGRYPGDPGPLGDECAGEVVAVGPDVNDFSPGDVVMALAPGSFSEFITVDSRLAVQLPNNVAAESAATIPVVFLTASYALQHLARIKKGDRVLIHAASGGLGQAAIQIAQQAGAEIFATASPAKWDVLRKLGVKHLMNSRELLFADEILKITHGQGVNIALNCLAGEFIPKTLSVVAEGGVFLEVGKTGIWSSQQIKAVKPGIAHFTIDLLALRKDQPELIKSMLVDLADKFASGEYTPISHKAFPLVDAADAFRYMQQARHTGKIVLVVSSTSASKTVSANIQISANASYIITGGTGGLGLLVARWLAEQGARRLVLLSRSGGDDSAIQSIQLLREMGAQVLVEKADVQNRDALAQIINQCAMSGYPLKGIVHAVGVLDDGALMHQTRERFRRVLAPKIEGAWHLHQLSQHLPLDFFMLFSSSASLLGTPGQANHAAANSFLDQLAHYRRGSGLVASTINWGAWSEVGAAARRNVAGSWESRGITSIDPVMGMDIFAKLLHQMPTQVGVVPVDWFRYLQQLSAEKSHLFYEDFVIRNECVRELSVTEIVAAVDIAGITESIYTGSAESLAAYLSFHVCRVLRIDSSVNIAPDRMLSELGLDSLTGIEIRNRIDKDLGIKLSLDQFFNQASLARWSEVINAQLALKMIVATNTNNGDNLEEDYEELTL